MRFLKIFKQKNYKFFRGLYLHFSFFKCPHHVSIFCNVSKIKITFFLISPAHPRPEFIDQSIQQKILRCLEILTKNKVTSFSGTFLYISAFKLSQLCYHFCRVVKIKMIFFFKYPYLSPTLCRSEFIDQSNLPKN